MIYALYAEASQHPWVPALLASLATGLGGVLVAGLSLTLPDRILHRILPLSLSFATGTLLGAVFLGLLPALSHALPGHRAFTVVLIGILLLHLLERTFLWRHCHEHTCEVHPGTRAIVLLGDGLHNFVDGLAIAAAFCTSMSAGMAVTLAVFVHEVPQELGDFSLLLKSGLSRIKALQINALVSLASLVGTAAGLLALNAFKHLEPYALALSAASFLYITMADLLPGHRKPVSRHKFIAQVLLILAGIAIVALVRVGHTH